MKLAILFVVLANAATARAECANSWSYTDLVGAAADGSYVTRTRSYVSMGKLVDKNMNEAIVVYAADGKPLGSYGRCAARSYLGDDDGCPEDGAKPIWRASGGVPPELIASDPKPDALVKALVKRLKLRPLERSATPVKILGAFVRAGGVVVKVIPEREVTSNIDGQPFVWRGRLFERPGQDSVLLELATDHFYRAYGGTCGYAVRTIELVPRARLDAKSSFAIDACIAAERYEPQSYDTNAMFSLRGSLQCLVDLGDERAIAVMPGLGEEVNSAPYAASLVAAKTNEKRLVEWAKGTDPKLQTFAFRAFAMMIEGLAKQPARRKRAALAAGPVCLAAIRDASDDRLDAAVTCVGAAGEWLGTRALVEMLAVTHDQFARITLHNLVRPRKDYDKVCASAESLRDTCDAID